MIISLCRLLVIVLVVLAIQVLGVSNENKGNVNIEELILKNRMDDIFDSINPIDTTDEPELEIIILNYKQNLEKQQNQEPEKRKKVSTNINNNIYKNIKRKNDIEHIKKHNDKAKTYLNKHFKKMNRPDSNYKHELVFAVEQQNLEELYKQLLDVSDIYSSNYGKYKTLDEVAVLTSNKDSTTILVDYLTSNGVTIKEQSLFGEYVTAIASISLWEEMFSTVFHEFHSISDVHLKGSIHLRAESYTIPIQLSTHVSTILNIIDIPDNKLKPMITEIDRNSHISLQTDSNTVDINLLNSYYSISNNGGMSSSQLVYATINQSFSPADLALFQTTYNISLQSVTNVKGGHNKDSDCVNIDSCAEGNLDIQYIMATCRNANTTFYYTDSIWTQFLKDVSSMYYVPHVISISYASYEYVMTAELIKQFDIEAQKLGLRGVTIVAASGDDGVAGFDLDGGAAICGYKPYFPQTSPFVTVCGGTEGPEVDKPETACGKYNENSVGIVTGGGFSDMYSLPNWQKTDVEHYLMNNKKNIAAGYAKDGRAYPDLALLARNYKVVINQKFYLLSGTSASAPVFAGMVALLNYRRKNAGRSTLGWLNPSLYALKSQIIKNDITSGKNNCGKSTRLGTICCSEGFVASKDWDPLTGIGSINFTSFVTAYMANSFSNNTMPYRPTSSPVASPGSPIPSPTPQPTYNNDKGWLYQVASDHECPIQAYGNSEYLGYPLESCINSYAENGAVKNSRKFQCVTLNNLQYIIREQHKLPFCSDTNPSITLYSTNCITRYDKYNKFQKSLRLFCDYNKNIESLSIFDSTKGVDGKPISSPAPKNPDYSVLIVYGDLPNQACNANDISRFYAVRNDFCFNYTYYAFGVQATISHKYSFPLYNIYVEGNCDSKNLQRSYRLSDQCYNINQDDDGADDDDGANDDSYLGFRQRWFFTGQVPKKKDDNNKLVLIITVVVVFTSIVGTSILTYVFRDSIKLALGFSTSNQPVLAVASIANTSTNVPVVEVQHEFIQLSPELTEATVIQYTPAFNKPPSTIVNAGYNF